MNSKVHSEMLFFFLLNTQKTLSGSTRIALDSLEDAFNVYQNIIKARLEEDIDFDFFE